MVLCLKARESRSLPGLPDPSATLSRPCYLVSFLPCLVQAGFSCLKGMWLFASSGAGWSSPVARQAHNLKVAGSNPAPATKYPNISDI
jgi:hypothetical protein